MSRAVGSALQAGREAIARHEWATGYELIRAVDPLDLEGSDLEMLAEAAWWTGNLDDSIEAREQAFASYVDRGNRRRASMVAMELAKSYFFKGSSAIGTAWVNRAERLLAGEPESMEHGWLHRLRSVMALEGAGDYAAALDEARAAGKIAGRFQDSDLLAVALHDEGRALVMLGDVHTGMALMDEATAPAIAGELTPYHTAIVYCNMITACMELADFGRAGDWSDAAKRWCERQAIAGFPGMCRVYRASIMSVRGAWSEAEAEARRAWEELTNFNQSYAAAALNELGELRLRAGDLNGAEQAFRDAHELGRDPQPGLALLRLAQHRLDGARQCLDQALADEHGDLHRARLLPAQVEVALAAGEVAAARAAADELAEIANRYGTDALEASAHLARARVVLAEGNASAALREARQAFRLWQAVGAPYEVARARVLLAQAHAEASADDDAVLELEAATSAFERLGARPAARSARELLARTSPRSHASASSRATRTFMFTDVEQSTKLVDAIGDDAWADLMRWHDNALRALFAEHGGEEVDHTGDGFFVAFEEPTAALDCAVAVQRTFAEHRRAHGFAPLVRIGLHTAEATRQAAGYKGKGVHEAARIAAVAAGGEIVAAAGVVPPGDRFRLSEGRRVELRGLDAPVDVVSIEWR